MTFPATRSLCSHGPQGSKLSLPDGETSFPDLSAALMYSVGHSRLCRPRNSIASDLWWLTPPTHSPHPPLRMITAKHVCRTLGRLAERHLAHMCLKRVKINKNKNESALSVNCDGQNSHTVFFFYNGLDGDTGMNARWEIHRHFMSWDASDLACLPSTSLPPSLPPCHSPSSLKLSLFLPPSPSVDLHQALSDSFGRSSSLLTTHASQIPFKQISN